MLWWAIVLTFLSPANASAATRGAVSGAVFDLHTGEPVPDASVQLLWNPTSAAANTPEKAVRTGADGTFELRAALGSSRSRIDWTRLLVAHPISLLAGPSVLADRTRVLKATSLHLRVQRHGFKAFAGAVRAPVADADRFRLTLDPIWLIPEDGPGVSFAGTGQRTEVITRFAISPPVVPPGGRAELELSLLVPIGTSHRYRARYTSTTPRLVESDREFSARSTSGVPPALEAPLRQAVHPRSELLTFRADIAATPSSVDRQAEFGFRISRDDGVALQKRARRTVLLIADRPERVAAARRLADGLNLLDAGRREEGLALLRSAASDSHAHPHSLRALAQALTEDPDAAAAEQVFRRMVVSEPDDYDVARPGLARSLLRSGRPAEALEVLKGAEQVRGKAQVPPVVRQLRILGYSQLGKYGRMEEEADLGAGVLPDASALLEAQVFRLRDEVARSGSDPYRRLALARALEDLGRLDEAQEEALAAQQLAPSSPWPLLDLGSILRRKGELQRATQVLRAALSVADRLPAAELALAGSLRELNVIEESRRLYQAVLERQPGHLEADLWSAILLYVGGAEAEALPALKRLTSNALANGKVDESGLQLPGLGIYWGPRRRAIAGFALPEVARAHELLTAHGALDSREAPHAHLAIGSALLGLGLPQPAGRFLAEARRLAPRLPEVAFELGSAALLQGDPAAAREEFLRELELNPRHPRARLELARALLALGDAAAASLQLAVHRDSYPFDDLTTGPKPAGESR